MSLWQIQARLKNGGTEWEPISLERPVKVGDSAERRYHYASLPDAQIAFEWYAGVVEPSLPNVIMRMAAGGRRLVDLYDIRFVEMTSPIPRVILAGRVRDERAGN